MEWIEYLASPDPDTGKKTFNSKLKKAFDTHDSDKDGLIDVQDLYSLLKDTLSELTQGQNMSTKIVIDKLVKSMAEEMMIKLDKSHDRKLDWPQFKNYMWYAREKENNLKAFIEYST